VYLGFLQQIAASVVDEGAGVFRFGGVGDADQVAVDVVAFGGVAGLARIVGAGGVDGAILVAVVAGLSQRIGAGVAVLARNGDVVGAQVAGAVVAIVDGLGLDGEAGERLCGLPSASTSAATMPWPSPGSSRPRLVCCSRRPLAS
jgi:hypothetical protein